VTPAAKGGTTRLSQVDRAYEELRRRILDNEMPAGFQITEQDLAAQLEVSRTPAREAMLRLANEGLVEIWPRHGMRVKPLSTEDMQEIYQILTALESAAAGLAAGRRPSPPELKEMKRCIAQMDAALARDDLPGWARADERFHRLLTEASGNRRLVALVDTCFGQSHRMRMLTLQMRPKPSTSNRDHEAVLQAILEGDAERAARIHREHREKSGQMLIELLGRYGLSQL
jgi:DNA-binding GntR family transcriptional regulator